MTIDKTLLDTMFHLMTEDADRRANDAGMSGSWGDGGADEILNGIKLYKAGMEGTIPLGWKQYENAARLAINTEKAESDPEFIEAKRLFEKHKGLLLAQNEKMKS